MGHRPAGSGQQGQLLRPRAPSWGLPPGSGANRTEAQFSITDVLSAIHGEVADTLSVKALRQSPSRPRTTLVGTDGGSVAGEQVEILTWHWELEGPSQGWSSSEQLPPGQQWALWGTGKGICPPGRGPPPAPLSPRGRREEAQLGLPRRAWQSPKPQQAAVFTEARCQSCFCSSYAWPW